VSSTVTVDDFMTGLLAGLALRGERLIDLADTRFDQAVAAAYEELLRRGTPGLEIDFEIIPDAVHGDSTVAQDALTAAIESRLVARVNPTFRRVRVVIDNPWAKTLMSELPGGAELYKDLTRAYMERYKAASFARA
jgi:hypothetical protein